MMGPLLPSSLPEYGRPEVEADPAQATSDVEATVGSRNKGIGVRPWLMLDYTGQARVVEAGKYAIMRRTGLPGRDLRILDPLLLYPSRVLGRERAIMINLEHIKAIITAHEVLLLNSRDPSVKPFVEELHRRILCFHRATKPLQFKETDEEGKADGKQALENRDGSKVLPFEFVALEACLEAACTCLDTETETLEQEAHPALDKLTSKVTPLNLERVRQIKSRLVEITARVQKVRDELEHLLDDDGDMAEMYLTDKMAQQHHENTSGSSINERDDMDDGVLLSDMDDRIPAEISLEANRDDPQNIENPQEGLFGAPNSFCRDDHEIHTSNRHSAISRQLGVEELEMLLEAYFVQIDGTLNKLSTLKEYVDDTEDYINIMLDDKQNQLLRMGVMLLTVNLVLLVPIVIVGVMGINIKIELWEIDPSIGTPKFLWTAGGCTAGSIFLYIVAIAYYKYKLLL